jgi:hypothetical protein
MYKYMRGKYNLTEREEALRVGIGHSLTPSTSPSENPSFVSKFANKNNKQ